MILTATIRTAPATGARNRDGLTMDVITAEGSDYDAAYVQLDAKLPDGWQMLSVRAD